MAVEIEAEIGGFCGSQGLIIRRANLTGETVLQGTMLHGRVTNHSHGRCEILIMLKVRDNILKLTMIKLSHTIQMSAEP